MENPTGFSPAVMVQKAFALASQHRMLTALVMICSLYFGFHALVDPKINTAPSQKITISGQFPFDKGLGLALKVHFYSRNPSCKQMARAFFIFPATEVDRSADIDVPVKRLGANQYFAEVAFDQLSPGFCDWEYGGMSYQILGGRHPNGKQLENSLNSALGQIPRRIRRATFLCEYSQIPKTDRLYVWCGVSEESSAQESAYLDNSSELNFVLKGK